MREREESQAQANPKRVRYSDPSSQQTQPPGSCSFEPSPLHLFFSFFFFLSLPLVYTQWRIKPKSTWTPSSTDCWKSVVAALESKFNCWRPKSATCAPRREKFSFRSLSSLNWRHPSRYESLLLCDTSGGIFSTATRSWRFADTFLTYRFVEIFTANTTISSDCLSTAASPQKPTISSLAITSIEANNLWRPFASS